MSDVARASTRAGGVLAATCISTLVVNANTSAVSILLPSISQDTGTSVETLQCCDRLLACSSCFNVNVWVVAECCSADDENPPSRRGSKDAPDLRLC
jgi:hypothetical protein